MQVINGLLRMSSGLEDEPLVVAQTFEPMRNVGRVLVTRFRRQTKVSGQKRGSKLSDEFFLCITFIAPAFATEAAAKALGVASPMRLMPMSA